MTKSETESRIQTFCLALLTIVTVAITLYLLRVVLVPFILAAFLTLVMVPIVDFMVRRLRVGRSIALVITLFIGFLLLLGVGGIVSVSVTQFAANAGEYERQLNKLIERAEKSIPLDSIVSMLESGEKSATPEATAPVEAKPVDGTAAEIAETPPPQFDAKVLLPKGAVKGMVTRLTSNVLAVLQNMLLVMLFTAFLLTGGTANRKETPGGVVGEIQSRVQKYIAIKIILSSATGFLVFIILKLLNVDYALSFGAFAFILNFIPNVGSLIATLLPLPIVLLTPDVAMTKVILVFALPMAVQFTIGSVLEPKIMGDTLGLHPVVILMALIFWGILWGFAGMLLAVPMTAIAKIIFERVEVTQPIAYVMAGKLDMLDSISSSE